MSATQGRPGVAGGRGLAASAAALLLVVAAWQPGQDAWERAKASVAQRLLERAWDTARAGAEQVQPWPGADAWPIARLSVPQLGVERFVLANATGGAGHGPAHVEGTALPGEAGNSVIASDCHPPLAFLHELGQGAEILLETQAGAHRRYVVRYTQSLDSRDVWILKQEGPTRLTLMTCWPGESRPGGKQSYVVSAYALDESDIGAGRAANDRGGERADRAGSLL